MSERNYWTRQGSRRLSRRTLLGVSARSGVGAAGLALVGCGDDDDDAAVADAPAARMISRRVVTGIDDDGKSYFVHDGETPGHLNSGFFVLNEIWVDDPSNPDPGAILDPAQDPVPLSRALDVPAGGSLCRALTFKGHSIAERMIGRVRRECLDRVLVWTEPHLRRVLGEFVRYYNDDRPHRALNLDPPNGPPTVGAGRIVTEPVLGGLHHVYRRAA